MHEAFAYPWLLLGLAALPVLSLLTWLAGRRRQAALIRLGGLVSGVVLARQRPSRLVRWSVAGGLTCLAAGMAGPRWGKDWSQSAAPGRDLVVVVDLSRSMFAEAPSRLERARAGLFDLADKLRHRGGYRLALVVFAGKARLVCPLTHDVEHFRECVDGLDPLAPPEAGLGTGTRIGAGLSLAAEAFTGAIGAARTSEARDVLLLSDGDDPARDGEFRAGIARALAEDVPVHVVGLGDAGEMHRIPAGTGWLGYKGKDVETRLEEAPLREIARRTRGQLLLPGLRNIALGDHYLAIAAREQADSPENLPVLRQRPLWFLLPALVLLTASLILPAVPARRGVNP